MRYANHECAGCGRIVPANQLVTVSDRVETGTSQHQRYSKKFRSYQNSGQTRHYANRSKRLCRKCQNSRIIKTVLGALGGVALLPFVMHGGSAGSHHRTSSPTSPSQRSTPEAQARGDDLTAKMADAQQPSHNDEASARTADNADLAQQIVGAPQDFEPVSRAIEKAGVSGAATRWHVHGLHGYAVPSAAGSDGCRMVQVSIDGGEQAQPTKWCPNSLAPPDR